MEKELLETVTLRAKTVDEKTLEAIFVPEKGMNFISFKKGEIEAIEQSTHDLFEERAAGLGAMIGPHFHHRKVIPPVPDESLFPHIAGVKAKGVQEPFSHGIGRYAPWKIEEKNETSIRAILRGKDEWKGIPLSVLEGQDFTMRYVARLNTEGLLIDLSVVSDTSSVIGLHTYYALPGGRGKISAQVQENYSDKGNLKLISEKWGYQSNHTLNYSLEDDIDVGFFPFPNPLEGSILLETSTHRLKVSYLCENAENSWQLWHPKGKPFVCIEPLSAKNPRKPHLSVSRLQIFISIL